MPSVRFRRAALRSIAAATMVLSGLVASSTNVSAAPADAVLSIQADTTYDGLAPIPAIDNDPAVLLPAGYAAGVGEDRNGEVATYDRVGYRITVALNLASGSSSTSEKVQNIKVTATLPVGVSWAFTGAPAGCTSATGAGTNVMVCTVTGPMQTGDVLQILPAAFVTSKMTDGSSITMNASVKADYIGAPVGSTVGPASDPAENIVVRTTPSNINLRQEITSYPLRYLGYPDFQIVRDPATGDPIGVDLAWPAHIEPSIAPGTAAGVKGYSGLTGDTATYTLPLSAGTAANTAFFANATISGCGTASRYTGVAPFGNQYVENLADGTNQQANLSNSGTWTCTQPGGPGSPLTLTVTGADLSAPWFPSGLNNGVVDPLLDGINSQFNEPYNSPVGFNTWLSLAQGYVTTRVPWAAVVAADTADGSTDQKVVVCVTAKNDLTLTSAGTITAQEATTLTGDNSECHGFTWAGGYNNFSHYYGRMNGGGGLSPVGDHVLDGGSDAVPTPGTTAADDEVLRGGHFYMAISGNRPNGAAEGLKGHTACHAFDGQKIDLVPYTHLPPALGPLFKSSPWFVEMESAARPTGFPARDFANDWLVEFASVTPFANFSTLSQVDSNSNGTVDCDDPAITNWTTDPTTLTSAGNQVNLIRIKPKSNVQIAPGITTSWMFEARVNASAAVGDLLLQATRFKAANVTQNGGLGRWDIPCTANEQGTCTVDGYNTTSPWPTGVPFGTRGVQGYPSYAWNIGAARNGSNWDRMRVTNATARIRKTDQGPLPSDYVTAPLKETIATIPSGDVWNSWLAVDLNPGAFSTSVTNLQFTDVYPSDSTLVSSTETVAATILNCDGINNPSCITTPASRTDAGKTTSIINYGTIALPANTVTTAWAKVGLLTPLAVDGTKVTNVVTASGTGMQSSFGRFDEAFPDQNFSDDSVALDRNNDRVILSSSPVVQVRKAALDPLVPKSVDFKHKVSYLNPSTNSISQMDLIDVLPRTGMYTPASAYSGTVTLGSIDSSAASHLAQTYVSSHVFAGSDTPPGGVTGDLDPNHASNSGVNAPGVAGGFWACTLAQIGTAGCPATLSGVTAVRWILNNLNPAQGGSLVLTFHPVGDVAADVFTNRAGARGTGLPLPIFSDPTSTRVFSGSIGDLVYTDINRDGKYTAGVDTPLAGISVNLFNATTSTFIRSATTNAQGRWVLTGLDSGSYYVEIPAAEFSASGHAFGYRAPSQAAAIDPAAGNEDTDHDGIGFQPSGNFRSSTVFVGMTGSTGSFASPGPLGDGPTDGATALDATTPDGQTWFTVDLALTPPIDLSVTKTVSAGPHPVGSNATYTVTLSNNGPAAATGVTVHDLFPSQLTPVSTTPSSGTYDAATSDWSVPSLASGASAALSFVGTVQAGTEGQTVTNTAEVTIANEGDVDSTPNNQVISEDDQASVSFTVGRNAHITIIKKINANDANTAPGVPVSAGSTMAITYEVTNTGTEALTNVIVTDSVAVTGLSCPATVLAVGASMTCSASFPAPAVGTQHANTATASAKPPLIGAPIADVTATDVAFAYVPVGSALTLMKKINGNDADTAPGVSVTNGSSMNVSFVVTNTGNTRLNPIVITDDTIATTSITCPVTALNPGGTTSCTASLLAPSPGDQHVNHATATGTPVTAADGSLYDPATGALAVKPTATDAAYAYVPLITGLSIVKKINGNDANTVPGATVATGSMMNVTFVVTNTGITRLNPVDVTDDAIASAAIICPSIAVDAGDSMTCTASFPAPAPGTQHVDHGSVTGTPVSASDVPLVNLATGLPATKPTATDAAYAYVPLDSKLTVVKKINGNDANSAPGVAVPSGVPMNITFVVTNTGNTRLNPIAVTDDTIASSSILCPASALNPGDTTTCTASFSAPAIGVQHINRATVTGSPVTSTDGVLTDLATGNPAVKPTATDLAYGYAVVAPAISLVKKINGNDADSAPGVLVPSGVPMNITFVVTNTGNTRLNPIAVTDDTIAAGAISCPTILLDPNESTTCTASLTPPNAGVQHRNQATATGTPVSATNVLLIDPATGLAPAKPSATDAANAYTPVAPAVTLVKKINGNDANTAPGIQVAGGSTMQITFDITNVGNILLDPVIITDDKVATGSITCPKSTLLPGEAERCSATLPAPDAGTTHTDVATVTAQPAPSPANPSPSSTTATDSAHAWVANPAISLVKKINGSVAPTAPGQTVAFPGTMQFTFEVTNTGSVALSSVVVTDSVIAPSAISCPKTQLLAGESMTCTATLASPAPGVQHTNVAVVTGQPPVLADGTTPPTVRGTDTANAVSLAAPGVSIVKLLNGQHVPTTPVLEVPTGTTMNFAITVTNTGNTMLDPVTVTDDTIPAASISCPKTKLSASETMTCTASLPAPAAGVTHTDHATVNGVPASPSGVVLIDPATGVAFASSTDTDTANAVGTAGGVTIVKTINGADANLAPGIAVAPGSLLHVNFIVTNSGTSRLDSVTVTDDVITTGIACPASTLAAGATMTCSAILAAPAIGGTHLDHGTVTAQPIIDGVPVGPALVSTDPANAITAAPGVMLVKMINGQRASSAPGLKVANSQTPLLVTFDVTNTGNTLLAPVTVTDDTIATAGISCPATQLGVGATMRCTATLAAPEPGAQHTNQATATATPVQADSSPIVDPDTGLAVSPVSSTDQANAFVSPTAGLSVTKTINGIHTSSTPGVQVSALVPMQVGFSVTNTGNTMLDPVIVTDSTIANGDITCPATTLTPGATMMCTATLPAPLPGVAHHNTATVTGTPVTSTGLPVTDPTTASLLSPPTATDDGYAWVPRASLSVTKKINGDDANASPGVASISGLPLAVTFLVVNDGSVPEKNVTVTDDTITASSISCPKATLLVGEAMTCTAMLAPLRVGENHHDIGTATGTPVDPSTGATLKDPYTALDLVKPVATDAAYSFGIAGPGQEGHLVWLDLNGNGAHDLNEPGVAGLTITIVHAGLDGVLGTNDDITYTTTTDNNGAWSIVGMPLGSLTVTVTVPAGVTVTGDPDATADGRSTSNLTVALPTDFGDDFGLHGGGHIGDTVFVDMNANGTQDINEHGISGVDVTVIWYGIDGVAGNDDIVFVRTTDINGRYSVDGLPHGAYLITVDRTDLPVDFTDNTAVPIGGHDSQMSVTLDVSSDSTDTVDFGYAGSAQLSHTVWIDLNGDNARDADEPGIPGVLVTVTWFGPDGVSGGGDDVIFTTRTDGSGNYTVAHLPAGTFVVAIDPATLPASLQASYDLDGTPDRVTTTTLSSGQHRSDVNFAERGTVELGDLVWFDRNRDGSPTLNEPGLPGVTVHARWAGLDGIAGSDDDVIFTSITDGAGRWSLEHLPAGAYTVTHDGLPMGTTATTPADWLTPMVTTSALTADLGVTGTCTIYDTVWYDWNFNGIRDRTDSPMPNVHINITWIGPDRADGTHDTIRFETITDQGGEWKIDHLPCGTFLVETGVDNLPGASRVTSDSWQAKDGKAVAILGFGETARPTVGGIGIGRTKFLPTTGSDPRNTLALAGILALVGLTLIGTRRRKARVHLAT